MKVFCFDVLNSLNFPNFFKKMNTKFNIQKRNCVIYDVGGTDPSKHRKMGKCRQPTKEEERKREKYNKDVNQEAEDRIASRKEKWEL